MIRTDDCHRMAIYAEDALEPFGAKTAHCLVRYRREDVACVIDATRAGTDLGTWYGFGAGIPVVEDFGAALAHRPDSLVIGLAPRGGRLTPHARACVEAAIERGLTVISGMHVFLADDERWARLAERSGSRLVDLRRVPPDPIVTRGLGFSWPCPVVLTVGTDCNVGKMTAAYEIVRRLRARGYEARFAATGQTGILLAQQGLAIDRVVSDFVGGMAERLVEDLLGGADVVVVEGQGSIYHPAYGGVTLGLMLGVLPDGLVLCHHAGRREIEDYPVTLPPLVEAIRDYERCLERVKPAPVLGVALNAWGSSPAALSAEAEAVRAGRGVPAADLFGEESDSLVEAVEAVVRRS